MGGSARYSIRACSKARACYSRAKLLAYRAGYVRPCGRANPRAARLGTPSSVTKKPNYQARIMAWYGIRGKQKVNWRSRFLVYPLHRTRPMPIEMLAYFLWYKNRASDARSGSSSLIYPAPLTNTAYYCMQVSYACVSYSYYDS